MSASARKYVLAFLSVAACAYVLKLAFANGDFKVFTEAGKLLGEKKNIYTIWIYTDVDVSCLYYYSPLFAMLLSPFRYFPQYVPNLIWQIAGIFWTIRCWQLISRNFNLELLSSKEKNMFLIFSFLLIVRFLLYNFDMIQMTIFLLWSILESVSLFEKKKDVPGSLLLALAINIKLMPLVVIPYLVYRMKFIPVLLTILFSVLFLFLPGIFIGFDYNSFLLQQWWLSINPAQGGHLVETGLGVHSLTALVPSLLMPTEGDMDMKRNLFSFSPETADLVTNLVRAFFILFTLRFTGLFPGKQVDDKKSIWEISYLTMIIPLIFPHQQKYAFFLLLPASAYLVYFLLYVRRYTMHDFGAWKWNLVLALLIVSFCLTTLSTDGVIGRHYNQITQHLKFVTWGVLIMTGLLSVCPPRFLSPERA